MVSVDMVGYGSVFNVRTMGIGPRTVLKSLRRSASRQKLKMPYLADKSRYGSSDHEPFERKSIPAAWLEWRRDPTCHTSKDAPGPREPAAGGHERHIHLELAHSDERRRAQIVASLGRLPTGRGSATNLKITWLKGCSLFTDE